MADNVGNYREAYIKQETVNVLMYGHVNSQCLKDSHRDNTLDDIGCTKENASSHEKPAYQKQVIEANLSEHIPKFVMHDRTISGQFPSLSIPPWSWPEAYYDDN